MSRSDNNEPVTAAGDAEQGIPLEGITVQVTSATGGSAKIDPASLSVRMNLAGVTCFDYSSLIVDRRRAYLLANRGPLSEDTSEAE